MYEVSRNATAVNVAVDLCSRVISLQVNGWWWLDKRPADFSQFKFKPVIAGVTDWGGKANRLWPFDWRDVAVVCFDFDNKLIGSDGYSIWTLDGKENVFAMLCMVFLNLCLDISDQLAKYWTTLAVPCVHSLVLVKKRGNNSWGPVRRPGLSSHVRQLMIKGMGWSGLGALKVDWPVRWTSSSLLSVTSSSSEFCSTFYCKYLIELLN